jgi:hypothetical protein
VYYRKLIAIEIKIFNMGNSTSTRFSQSQFCCQKGLCAPQYEITFQEFEYKTRSTPCPSVRQEIFKSFAADLDSQLTTLDSSRQVKLEQAASYAKTLKLQVLSSSTLKKSTEFVFTPLGCEGSFRAGRDGLSFFGVKKNQVNEEGLKAVVNDIVIPIEDRELAEQHRGQHFCLFYDVAKDCYCVKDLSVGFGIFVKVIDSLVLKDNYLLHMGDHYLLVNVIGDVRPELKVKVFGPLCVEKVMNFSAEESGNMRVRIGRAGFCQVVLEDNLVSKIQCCVVFDGEKWIARDGDGEKPSTNGVWLYLSEAWEIKEGMVFKTNHTVLMAGFD